MSQENTDEKTPQKRTLRRSPFLLCLLISFPIGLLLGFVLDDVGPYPLPLNTMPITGTINILDEHGEAMPFQPIKITCFSHYAMALSRSEYKRTQFFHVNESGKLSLKIPEFAATLCFLTHDKKYAAVVDITPDMPPTDLTITLIPTYTITGRLVGRTTNTPIANHKIELKYNRFSERGKKIPGVSHFNGSGRILLLEETTTDAEGFFTFDNVVPGIEYVLGDNFHSHLPATINVPLAMPILEPEQYREPFDLEDVLVR